MRRTLTHWLHTLSEGDIGETISMTKYAEMKLCLRPILRHDARTALRLPVDLLILGDCSCSLRNWRVVDTSRSGPGRCIQKRRHQLIVVLLLLPPLCRTFLERCLDLFWVVERRPHLSAGIRPSARVVGP